MLGYEEHWIVDWSWIGGQHWCVDVSGFAHWQGCVPHLHYLYIDTVALVLSDL